MNAIFPEAQNIVYALSWALVHALWQGLLIYALLKIALRLLPENYSAARYYTAVAALGAITGWFLLTLVYRYNQLGGAIASNTGSPAPVQLAETNVVNNTPLPGQLLLWYNMHTTTIVTTYIIGIALLLLRLVYNLFALKTLGRSGTSVPTQAWLNKMDSCLSTLQISKRVQLRLSTKISVPMVMGTLKPIILVPAALANQLTIQEVEAILLHELAHVKRNDYLVNIIQMFIETILFYNPFVWLVSSVIRKEREHCCDDIVITKTADRLPYARALATLEAYRLYPAAPALAATGHKNQLLNRIKRMMEMKNRNINYGQLTAVLLIVVLLLTAVAFVVPEVNAQDKKDKKKKKDVTKTEVIVETSGKGGKQHAVSSSTSPAGTSNSKSTQKTIIRFNDDETVELEENVEKEALKTAQLALETANDVLTEIDISGMVANAMKSVNWEGISTEISDSLEKVDWDAINAEIKEAMKEVNTALKDVKAEIKYSGKETDKEIAEAKKRIAVAKKEIAQAGREIAVATREAADERREAAIRQGKEHAAMARQRAHDRNEELPRPKKTNITAQNLIVVSGSKDDVLEAMEKDGLINRAKGFKIEKDGNELYIDGIKQSKEVLKKYQPMLNADKVTIKGNRNHIKMSMED